MPSSYAERAQNATVCAHNPPSDGNTIGSMDLVRTAAAVTAFSAAEHCLGFLYRILLSRTLGAEGLGRYQMALTVFSVLVTLCASGIPVTLSRTVAAHRTRGDVRAGRSAVTAAVLLALGAALPIALLLFCFRPLLAGVFSDTGAENLFFILLPGLPFTAVYAVIRGSFWGEKRFFMYSFVELFEETAMIAAGTVLLVLVSLALPRENLAAGAVLLSHLCSFGLALGYFFARGGSFRTPKGQLRPLLTASLPVTAMRASSSAVHTLVSVLFPLRLAAAGATSAAAMSEYGIFYGMVMPVMMIPATFVSSMALVLVPEFSECAARGERETLSRLTEKALRAALLIAGVLLPLYAVLGRDLGILLYDSPKSGILLSLGSVLLLPMSVTMISGSLLNSLRCEKQTLLIFLAGAGAMLLSVFFLTGKIAGGALLAGMAGEYALSALLSLGVLKKRTGRLCSGVFLLRLLAAAGGAVLAGLLIRSVCFRFFGFFPALVLTFLLLAAAEAALFGLLRLIRPGTLAGLFLRRRRKQAAKLP